MPGFEVNQRLQAEKQHITADGEGDQRQYDGGARGFLFLRHGVEMRI